MNNPRISRSAALRIGLAGRALPNVSPRTLVPSLIDVLGEDLTEDTLDKLDLRRFKVALQQSSINASQQDLQRALSILRGSASSAGEEAVPLPTPQHTIKNAIRVALASNRGEEADGHFATCLRFLVYLVSPTATVLADVRPTDNLGTPTPDRDKNVLRAELINDCQLLYVVSIGGPAAAKVVKQGVHPLKLRIPDNAHAVIDRLQAALLHPPPWLAKAMRDLPHPSAPGSIVEIRP